MRTAKIGSRVLCFVLLAATAARANAFGVPIGSSTLVKVLDYSDTFTTSDNGGLPDRDGIGGWPLSTVDYPVNGAPGEGLAVEHCYGNPQQYWCDYNFSIRTDATALYREWYPQNPFSGSGAGSDTGMIESGGYTDDGGFAYDLRERFVVQYDAIQSSSDRTGITFGPLNPAADPWDVCNLANPDTFSIFIRTTGNAYGDVGIWNSGVGEVNTGLTSPIMYGEEWHNYALLVDTIARTVQVFIDEVSIGTINIDTVGGGVFAGRAMSNDAVIWSYCDADYLHYADNFQVGSPDAVSPVRIPGDADGNHVVNAADAERLAENWGATTFNTNYVTWWEMGDFNGDQKVNAADAAILAANWTDAAESAAVPEPSAVLLLAIGLGTMSMVRRRR
jgi:hypothetical protein